MAGIKAIDITLLTMMLVHIVNLRTALSHPLPQRQSNSRSSTSDLITRAPEPLTLQLDVNNLTVPLVAPSALNSHITCFGPASGLTPTTVDGCRPTLNELRTWPDYRRVQDFQEGVHPLEPQPPPLIVHNLASNCALQVKVRSAEIVDRFSFEQVRTLGADIVEECQGQGGFGGVAPIGRGIGWIVTVIGFEEDTTSGDGNSLNQGNAGHGNGTNVAILAEKQ